MQISADNVAQAVAMAPAAAGVMRRIGGAKGVMGRVAGFSPDEIDRGLPWWSWALIGVGIGCVVGYAARPEIDRWG